MVSFGGIVCKLFGFFNDCCIKFYCFDVVVIGVLEDSMKVLSDVELVGKIVEFKV